MKRVIILTSVCLAGLVAAPGDATERSSSKTGVVCGRMGERVFKVAPRNCIMLKPHCPATSACYIAAEKLDWNWGPRKATAHAACCENPWRRGRTRQ